MRIKASIEIINRPNIRLHITLFFCVLIIAGLLFSKALMSIGTIGIALNVLFNTKMGQYFKVLIHDAGLLALMGMFLIFALSGINSTNLNDYTFAVRTKLPFLFMPLCLLQLREMTLKQYHFLLTVFTYFTTIACAIILIYACLHFDSHTFGRGGTFETPANHVRYSIIVALSIVMGLLSLYDNYNPLGVIEKGVRILCILFLTIFLHLLAVRSGLIAFYFFIVFTSFFYLFKKRKGGKALFILAGAAVLFSIAFVTVPSLKIKREYMEYEWHTYTHGQAVSQYGSDMGRWRSYKVAFALFKAHPIWGVGIGDLQDSTNERYKKIFPNAPVQQRFTAHNQYLFVLSAMGIIGGGIFITLLFVPIFYNYSFRNYLYLYFQFVMLISFIFEAPLQEQEGTTLYWFFTLFLYHYTHRNHDN